MKYLILTTLLLMACNNTTGPSVCREYESVIILHVLYTDGSSRHTYTYYESVEKCMDAGELLNVGRDQWACNVKIDNTGCN